MSVPVDLGVLQATATALGDEALLVTVSDGARPHVVSALVRWRAGRIETSVGRRTAANVEHHPLVTLLWPTPHDGYRLIVDGGATVDGDTVSVTPTFAVLHRIAGSGGGPGCLPMES